MSGCLASMYSSARAAFSAPPAYQDLPSLRMSASGRVTMPIWPARAARSTQS